MLAADAFVKRRRFAMKKIMSLMLGLSLVFGAAAFAADEKKADAAPAAKHEKKAKKAKKDAKADAAAAEKHAAAATKKTPFDRNQCRAANVVRHCRIPSSVRLHSCINRRSGRIQSSRPRLTAHNDN